MRVSFKKLIALIAAALMMTVSVTYTFWKGGIYGSDGSRRFIFQVGKYPYVESEKYPDLSLPEFAFIPENIRDQITSWKGNKDVTLINKITEVVVRLYEYADFAESSKLLIEAALEDFFTDGPMNVSGGDYILYVTGEGKDMEVVLLHISSGNYNFSSPQQLLNALNDLWNSNSGVMAASPVWTPGTAYTWRHAAIEYTVGDETRHYYFQNTSDRVNSPAVTVQNGSDAWFWIKDDLSLVTTNVYPLGFFVSTGSGYVRAAQGAPWMPQSTNGWPWVNVPLWQPGTYTVGHNSARNAVYTIENGQPRFWEVLRQTSHEPNEQNCNATADGQSGYWREVKNAWIGEGGQFGVPKTYYAAHNTYFAGDIVVDGIAPNMKYRFYRARSFVPHNEPPLIRMPNGQLELNQEFWERW